MGSVRNAQKAITPIVAIDPNAKAKRQRLGKVVLEVSDPTAQADLGEQLSLTDMVSEQTQTSPSTRKTSTKSTKATVSKARQKASVEASLKVPIELQTTEWPQPLVPHSVPAPAEQQILDQVQQLGSAIEQLQSRLDRLHQQSDQTVLNPRLPDWSEPELRPHYTLKQARTAYEALEHQEHQRKLQTAAPAELQAAQQVAQRLRTHLPNTPSHPLVQTTRLKPSNAYAQRRSRVQENRLQSNRRQQSFQVRRSRRRFCWNGQQFVRNIYGLVQRLIPIPADPATKLVDAAVWVLVSIGLRFVLKLLVQLLPFSGWPISVLLAIPAMIAAYLAFCVEDSRSDVIYRLLLITVGLFLGSRL